MTRQEYLKKLKNNISALPLEEQEEALEYYEDYFADADNDERVMSELGSPEELAQSIKDKFACVPAASKRNENKYEEKASKQDRYKYEFNAGNVRCLDISLGAAEVVMISSGTTYKVEARGLVGSELKCELSPYGTLSMDNVRKIPFLSCFRNIDRKNWHPRILITVPENTELDMLKLHIGAGSFETREIKMKSSKSFLDVGAGNLIFNSLFGGRLDIRCGMGNVEVQGEVTGFSRIDCGMGQIKLNLKGIRSEYSYDAKVGLGEVTINGEHRSGFGQTYAQERKANHFAVKCGMGAVKIDVKE